jgi:hypothetical protein
MIMSSARSLGKLAAFMANKGEFDGKRIISESTWDQMHDNRTLLPHYGMNMRQVFSQGGVCIFDQKALDEEDLKNKEKIDQMNANEKKEKSFVLEIENQSHNGREDYVGWFGLGGSVF